MLSNGDLAPDATVYDGDSKAVKLSALWKTKPVVLSFMRHFGCIHSRHFQSVLRQENARIVEAGAQSVVVFMGQPGNVADYCAQRNMPFVCLADPDRSAYRAYDLPTRIIPMNVGAVAKGVRLFAKGLTTGLPHPGQDIRQMGGSFVIEKGGRLRLSHVSRDPSSLPSIAVILGALGAS